MCPLLGLWWWNWRTMTVATTDIPTITMVLAKYCPKTDGGAHFNYKVAVCWEESIHWVSPHPHLKKTPKTHKQIHTKRNWPIRGTESDVAGIISATISMKTVRESRTVMPGGRHRTPGSSGLQLKKKRESLVEQYIWYGALDFSPLLSVFLTPLGTLIWF